MAKIPVKYAVVDAFTELPFKGNPAAVCLLEDERDDYWLQSVACEFNISETCYLTRITDHDSTTISHPRFRLRWFTPVAEVDLCGHATLAAAHFLFTSGLVSANAVEFSTLSGVLTARRVLESPNSEPLISPNAEPQKGFLIELDFPAISLVEFDCTELPLISKALNGISFSKIWLTTAGDNLLVELPTGKDVTDFKPQIEEIQKCPRSGLIITAVAPPESEFDFISRYFCPKFGINEDPVCGSAHCSLAPYWSKKLGKSNLVAYQASPRGGILNLLLDEKHERLLIRGKAVTVMEGRLLV